MAEKVRETTPTRQSVGRPGAPPPPTSRQCLIITWRLEVWQTMPAAGEAKWTGR